MLVHMHTHMRARTRTQVPCVSYVLQMKVKKKKTSHNVTGKALIECVRQARLTRVFHTDGDERLLL